MKNRFKFIIFSLAIAFSFTTKVSAGLCGQLFFQDPDYIYDPIGKVPVRVCTHESELGPFKANIGPFNSVSEAEHSCETTYTAKANKHTVTVHIGPCSEDQVEIDWSCTYNYDIYGCPSGTYEDEIGCRDKGGNYYDYVKTGVGTGTDSYPSQSPSTEGDAATFEEKCNAKVNHYNCSCKGASYLRYEYYQVVCDETGIREVDANGNIYELAGEPAYCINPSYLFPENGSTWDSTFDVTDCKNARTSKECGYASILIEGERMHASYGAIATALRLWGADSTFVYDPVAGGFDDTGLPVRGPNGEIRNFQPEYINIYTHTVAHIEDYIKSGISIEDVKSTADLRQIQCSPDLSHGAGMVCGFSANYDYLDAIYLYLNTVQGNPHMLEHLNAKLQELGYDTTNPKEVVKVTVTNYNEETHEVELTEILAEDVEVDCNKLDEENKKYCKAPKQRITADVAGFSVDITDEYYDYCVKNRCVITIQPPTALCDYIGNKTTKTLTISFDYEKTVAQTVVKKFISCTGSTYEKEQIMFVYDLKNIIHNTPTYYHYEEDFHDKPVIKTKYICKCGDDTYDGPETFAYGAGNFDKASFDNTELEVATSVSENINNVCGNANSNGKYNSTNTFLSGPYDTYTKSSVYEPSLAKIVNMCRESKKELYDYSSYYGVNPKVCKIYCRDEVNFYLANKTKVYAGMTFKYDITTRLKDYDNLIANQVRAGKNAKYNYTYELVNGNKVETLQNSKEETDKRLLTSVIVEQRECVSKIFYHDTNDDGETWTGLYNKQKSQGEQKQLIYDLENCNLYGGKNSDKEHKINVDVVVQAINKSDTEKYTTIDYLEKQTKLCKDSECPTMNLTYKDVNGNNSVKMDLEKGLTVSNVSYCTGVDSCYQYRYDSSTNTAKDIYGGNNSFHTGSVKVIGEGNVTIPTNDYAAFTISKEYDFYNNSQYYTKVEDGAITTESGEDRLALDKYSYPTSANTVPGSYDTKQQYTMTSSMYRKKPNDTYASLLEKLNTYSCYVDMDNKTKITVVDDRYTLGYSFKNIDSSNLFPSDKESENVGLSSWKSQYAVNWDTPEANEIQAQIESTSDKLFVTDDLLEYRVKLTPNNIKTLRDYNKRNNTLASSKAKGYLNKTLYDCTEENEMLLRCKSSFIKSIKSGEFGISFEEFGGNK